MCSYSQWAIHILLFHTLVAQMDCKYLILYLDNLPIHLFLFQSLAINWFMILEVEYLYLRESMMQLACTELKTCNGGSSFDQLLPLKEKYHINDGSILVEGHITYNQMVLNFWRAFITTLFQFTAILCTLSISIRLGFFSNKRVSTKMDEINRRPAD